VTIIKAILRFLYQVWVFLVFTSFMLLFLPGILLPGFFGPRAGTVTFFFMKLWSWVFSKLNVIPYDMIDRQKIRKGQSYIYVSNHTSFLDLPGIAMAIRGQFRALAKKELLKIPVFGWITRVTCVVVDRSSNESRRKSMDHLKKILGMGVSILLFPEGTQNRTQEKLQPFYDGAFRIAVETQEPILPMVVLGANKLMPPGKVPQRPGRIRIVIGDEIPTKGLALADVGKLKERTMAVMNALIEKHTS
jgi:1-acyl-sn-glycerol-3-phosphate acyltransferase